MRYRNLIPDVNRSRVAPRRQAGSVSRFAQMVSGFPVTGKPKKIGSGISASLRQHFFHFSLLSQAKILAAWELAVCTLSSILLSAITVTHVPLLPLLLGLNFPLFARVRAFCRRIWLFDNNSRYGRAGIPDPSSARDCLSALAHLTRGFA